jgi:hypothetical protein
MQRVGAAVAVKALPLIQCVGIADIEDRRRLSVRQAIVPHVLQDGDFALGRVMTRPLAQAGLAMLLIKGDPATEHAAL